MSILRRALASVAGKPAPPPQPQPASSWGLMECAGCQVRWAGGPRCWCCGKDGTRFGWLGGTT